jgi:hypothetical protein
MLVRRMTGSHLTPRVCFRLSFVVVQQSIATAAAAATSALATMSAVSITSASSPITPMSTACALDPGFKRVRHPRDDVGVDVSVEGAHDADEGDVSESISSRPKRARYIDASPAHNLVLHVTATAVSATSHRLLAALDMSSSSGHSQRVALACALQDAADVDLNQQSTTTGNSLLQAMCLASDKYD